MKHGLRSTRALPPETPDSSLQDRVRAIVGDLGGDEAVSAVLLGQVQRHARLELIEAHLWANLEHGGVTTGKGATRAAALLWLQVVDRLQRSAGTLGLERKARKVQTVAEVLA